MSAELTDAKQAAKRAAEHFGKREDVMFCRLNTHAKPGFTTNHVVEVEFKEGVPLTTYDAVEAGFESLDATRVKRKDAAMVIEGHYEDPDD